MTITFFKTSPDQMNACAAYVARLTKEQVAFEIIDLDNTVQITLTGGF
jgi:hypothetical protein